MDQGEIDRRVVWLLAEAGPHKACELATFVGITTCDMEHTLRRLELSKVVQRVSVTSAETKWSIRTLPPAP